MKQTLAKYRAYRDLTATEDVRPIGFAEWMMSRIAGKLEVRVATLARKRNDNTALNHILLGIWAGNQSKGGHLVAQLAPAELSQAIRDGRLRLVLDPEPAPTTAVQN